MYAFTDLQRHAWQLLFDRFFELHDIAREEVELKFDHDPASLREPGLWFGHTCGYPLMTQLQPDFMPFCVPLFDVPGTEDKLYSSRIIATADGTVDSLETSRGRVCAMNNSDSNSGMNVLRHALADLARGEPFFNRVLTTGGHLHSLQAVAEGEADIAAIDCVSYQLIADAQPGLARKVKVIAETVKTCGLPLVMPQERYESTDIGRMVDDLNRALESCYEEAGEILHLDGFAEVRLPDYDSILQVEQYARDRGYPELA